MPDNSYDARATLAQRRYVHHEAFEAVEQIATEVAPPDTQLVVYTAEPRSRSEQALRELAAWAAENIGTSR